MDKGNSNISDAFIHYLLGTYKNVIMRLVYLILSGFVAFTASAQPQSDLSFNEDSFLSNGATPEVIQEELTDPPVFGMKWVAKKSYTKKHFHVYDTSDVSALYKDNVSPQNCFFVISKREFRLYVYADTENGIELVAHFPICLAKNTGDKHRTGDGTTPSCAKSRNGEYIPFVISQIANASTWRHDFHDGRGNVLAYGDWFMRLKLNGHPYVPSNTSIGIHGSSSNELSVPGRDSEGCIRLRNDDLNVLRKYASVGTLVIIKPENAGKLPYELEAQKKLGARYCAAKEGYKLPDNAVWINK